MNLLAIETSSTACSVSLLADKKIYSSHVIAPMQQTKLLLPTIDKLLQEASLSIKEINAFACGCGPGSFTGVRIAVSTVQGLAFGNDAPIILISSLAAAAQTAYDKHGWKNLLVAIDARVNEIYTAAYSVQESGLVSLEGEEQVISPKDLIEPENSTWFGVGNGWEIYKDAITFKPLEVDINVIPSSDAVLKLAISKFERKEWVTATEAIPTYIRNKVAEKQKRS